MAPLHKLQVRELAWDLEGLLLVAEAHWRAARAEAQRPPLSGGLGPDPTRGSGEPARLGDSEKPSPPPPCAPFLDLRRAGRADPAPGEAAAVAQLHQRLLRRGEQEGAAPASRPAASSAAATASAARDAGSERALAAQAREENAAPRSGEMPAAAEAAAQAEERSAVRKSEDAARQRQDCLGAGSSTAPFLPGPCAAAPPLPAQSTGGQGLRPLDSGWDSKDEADWLKQPSLGPVARPGAVLGGRVGGVASTPSPRGPAGAIGERRLVVAGVSGSAMEKARGEEVASGLKVLRSRSLRDLLAFGQLPSQGQPATASSCCLSITTAAPAAASHHGLVNSRAVSPCSVDDAFAAATAPSASAGTDIVGPSIACRAVWPPRADAVADGDSVTEKKRDISEILARLETPRQMIATCDSLLQETLARNRCAGAETVAVDDWWDVVDAAVGLARRQYPP